MGWIQPIDCITWAFYSTVPPQCLPSASPWGRLQTFNLGKPPLQNGPGLVLGPSAQSHVHQLQQEPTHAECAVPALLPSNPQPTALSLRGWMFLQNQDMGTVALGWDHIPMFLQQETPGLYEGVSYRLNCGFSLSLSRGHNGVQSCISALHSSVSGSHRKGINTAPPSMHGLFPHSHFSDSSQTSPCSLSPLFSFPLLPRELLSVWPPWRTWKQLA